MFNTKYLNLSLLLIGMLLSHVSFAAETKLVQFSKVYQVMHDDEQAKFAITDNGVWQINGREMVRIDIEESKQVVYSIDNYQQLFPKGTIEQRGWYDVASLGYLVLLIIFCCLYLYYQWALEKRRKSFYEKIKVQQQVLSIAFLATGEEVLDCDLTKGKITRLNQNAKLNLSDGIYFQSEEFISQIHPEDSVSFIAHFESLLSDNRDNYELNYRLLDHEQEWIWIAEKGSVIERNSQGKAIRLISSMRDITSIKHEQEQLARVINELELRLKRTQAALAR